MKSPVSPFFYPENAEDDDEVGALVWVFLAVYLVFLLGIAAHGFCRSYCGSKKEEKTAGNELEDHYAASRPTGALADHYVASRSLGAVVITLTIFATVYSGYTVVGVPGEVWAAGFFGFRWMFTPLIMFIPMSIIASRIQFLSRARNYISPTGFITDRYRSRELTTLTTLVMAFPAVVYAMSQFKSMGETVEALSDGDIDKFDAASVFCVIMLLYEFFGGLRAIAWTDAIQGGLLFVGFLFFFIAQYDFFGGITDSVARWQALSQPPFNLPPGVTMLSKWQLESWFAFAVTLFMSFSFYPHLIQRFQAAKSPKVIKAAFLVQPVGNVVVMLSSIITGCIAYRWFPYTSKAEATDSTLRGLVFGKVVRRAIQENVGYNILGSIMLAASVAAFMSTADSAIHAASACITLDIFKPIFSHTHYACGPFGLIKKDSLLLFVGKLVSLGVALFALFTSQVDMSLSALLIMQGAVLMQVAPAFWLGFYNTGVKASAVTLGMITGVVIAVYYQCSDTGPFPRATYREIGVNEFDEPGQCMRHPGYTNWFEPIDGIHPAIFGFIVNLAITIVFSFLPDFTMIRIAGEKLPTKFLAWDVDGTKRPWRNAPWCFVYWGGAIFFLFTTPWWKSAAWEEVAEPAETWKSLPMWVWECGAFGAAGIFCLLTSITFGWSDDGPQDVPQGETVAATSVEEGTGTTQTTGVELAQRTTGETSGPAIVQSYDGTVRSAMI